MIDAVREEDLADLLPLMRGYCDFYGVATPDELLLGLSRALLADPDREGVQLIARDDDGTALGFATLFWTWSTLRGERIAIMNDLFVAPAARGRGVADALITACRERSRAHGCVWLEWQTAKDNLRAQAVYDRAGGQRSEWIDYGLRP
jgi:GNAT superfamily N-acetyltransferase